MKKVLFVYVPFCTPASPPYSLTYLAGFIQRNSSLKVSVLDLNASVHKQAFPELYEHISKDMNDAHVQSYAQHILKAKKLFSEYSKKENLALRHDQHSELLESSLNSILEQTPNVVCLSVVYNSQAFFAQSITEQLLAKGIPVFVGGPAVTPQLKKIAECIPHEVALLEKLTGTTAEMNALDVRRILDYSLLDANQYFTAELVIPIKASSCCYYQQCTFCTHHLNGKYVEYSLEDIKESILLSKAKKVFFIDDMIHKKRLLDIAHMIRPLKVHWMCQLRPTKDLDEDCLRTLYESGLRQVIWGVESGNQRILNLMKKGTRTEDVEQVLRASKQAGICNVTYIMFGFPTETKEEFLDTIHFLKRNTASIDLISTSVFGLQEDAPIFKDYKKFGIQKVIIQQREKLPDSIDYISTQGMHNSEARLLRKKYAKTLTQLNRYPREMNVYREHLLFFLTNNKD